MFNKIDINENYIINNLIKNNLFTWYHAADEKKLFLYLIIFNYPTNQWRISVYEWR